MPMTGSLHLTADREGAGEPDGLLTTGHGQAQKRGMSTVPIRLLLVVVPSGAYLALAIAGRGGIGAFFAQPALIALTVVLVALCCVALAAGGNLSPGVREERDNRWVIAVFAVVGLLDAFLPAWSDRKGIWVIEGDAIRWLGVALFAFGGALRLWPVFVLGDRFSGLVAIQPGHRLVTNGIYGVIRHPSYLGLLISSLGWASRFAQGSAYCSRRCSFCRCWRGSMPKRSCCGRNSAPSTMPIAHGRRGSYRASTSGAAARHAKFRPPDWIGKRAVDEMEAVGVSINEDLRRYTEWCLG